MWLAYGSNVSHSSAASSRLSNNSAYYVAAFRVQQMVHRAASQAGGIDSVPGDDVGTKFDASAGGEMPDDPRFPRDQQSVRQANNAIANAKAAAEAAAKESMRRTSMGGGDGEHLSERDRLTGYMPLEDDRKFEVCCETCKGRHRQRNCACGACDDAPICWCSDEYRITSPDGASMCPPGFAPCPGDGTQEPTSL